MAKYQVSIVKVAESVNNSVRKALDLLHFSSQGREVLIKPNVLSAKTSKEGVTTDPQVVSALIDFFKEAGAKVFVGDSCGQAYPGRTREVFSRLRLMDVIASHGAAFADFDSEPPVIVDIPGGKVVKRIGLASQVLSSKALVNAPKLKTHVGTLYTGAIKNIAMGSIPGLGKGVVHKAGVDFKSFSEAIVDIFSVLADKVVLNVMDAIVAMEGNGPSNGRPVNMNLIAASRNALALDMVCSKLIGLEPMEVLTNRYASERGLGPSSLDEVEVVGASIHEVSRPLKLPSTFVRGLFLVANSLLYSHERGKPVVERSKCARCLECVRSCPSGAITLAGYPTINSSTCIKCYVCYEHCNYGAIKIKKGLMQALGF